MLKVKEQIILAVFITLLSVGTAFSQDFWEPQTNITGYISTELNYFDGVDNLDVTYGTAISEAGILVTYQPTSNFTLKSVFVYRPGFQFDQMLNEAYGQLKVNDYVNVKVGRFLLPLSPMNTYYYAPVNTSATLPLLVSNHEFFPLNADGISLNGKSGEDVKLSYDLFAGGFRNTTWLRTGAVGFFGSEVTYFSTKQGDPISIDESFNNTYNVAAGGNVALSYKQFATVGFSLFKQKDYIIPIGANVPADFLYPGSPAMYVVQDYEAKKLSYAFNAKLKYENTTVYGEYWTGDLNINNTDYDLDGAFVVVSQTINKVTPYVRFEHQTTTSVEYNRYTVGINYKPSFTRTVKAEYMLYEQETGNIGGLIATLIYSF